MVDYLLPRYKIPRLVLADLVLAGLLGQERRFREHALRMMPGIHPPMRCVGEENIPRAGPGLITVNHYNSPAFMAPWFPAAISAVVPDDIHWVMTNALTFPGRRLADLRRLFSTWILTQAARVYGFTSMPPMPPAPDEIAQRSAAVRRLVNYARSHPRALVGIAPEGSDQPGAVLGLPPPGFGKLALVFSQLGFPFYPVAGYEEDGFFFLHFGRPYCLDIEQSAARDQLDLLARQQVMRKIAPCLPPRLRGAFH